MSEAAVELRQAPFDLRNADGSDELPGDATLTFRDRERFNEADHLLRSALKEFEVLGSQSSRRALTWQLLAQLAFE